MLRLKSETLGLILVAFFAMASQHFVGLSDKTLSLSDALTQAVLARLDLCCVLLSPLSAFLGIRHPELTNRVLVWAHVI